MSSSTKPKTGGNKAIVPGSRTANALVLIVDDFEDNRQMYAEFLEFSGFRTEQAANGQEALDKAHALLPDVILMDLSLPGIDGWEATRRLKKDPRTQHIPVVALTGHALEGHSKGAANAGCDAFIAKPCLPEDLVNHVTRLVGAGGSSRPTAEPAKARR
jgi:CheY-like chemotaxis protein